MWPATCWLVTQACMCTLCNLLRHSPHLAVFNGCLGRSTATLRRRINDCWQENLLSPFYSAAAQGALSDLAGTFAARQVTARAQRSVQRAEQADAAEQRVTDRIRTLPANRQRQRDDNIIFSFASSVCNQRKEFR